MGDDGFQGLRRLVRSEDATPRGIVFVFYLAVFSLPWSSDMTHAAGGALSLAFNGCMVVLALHWLMKSGLGPRSQPPAYSIFVAFMLAHTLLFYGVFHPGYLDWSSRTVDYGYIVKDQISVPSLIGRFVIYAIFGYAISALHVGRDLLAKTGRILSSSLLVIVLLDKASLSAEARFAGGYANPNAFAEVCLLAALVNLAVLVTAKAKPGDRVLNAAGMLVGIVLLFMTGSRSAALALGLGFLGLLWSMDSARRAKLFIVVGLVLVALWMVSGGSAFQVLLGRISDGKVNLRSLIWVAYLKEWRDFLLVGAGFGREMTVLKEPIFLDKIWPPHNSFIRITVQFGLAGLALLLVLIKSYFTKLWRRIHDRSDGAEAYLAFGLLLAWVVLLGSGDRMTSRTFWLSVGLIGSATQSGLYRRSARDGRARKDEA